MNSKNWIAFTVAMQDSANSVEKTLLSKLEGIMRGTKFFPSM